MKALRNFEQNHQIQLWQKYGGKTEEKPYSIHIQPIFRVEFGYTKNQFLGNTLPKIPISMDKNFQLSAFLYLFDQYIGCA